MSENNRLPIQVVIPRKTDYNSPPPGGSKKYLEPFTSELQGKIMAQCQNLQLTLKDTFEHFPNTPCVGKVVMKEKAIAKTHKPTALFKENTCPIIGAEHLDEVLVKITPQGLQHLINTLKLASSEDVKKNITKIEKIQVYCSSEKIEIKGYESMPALSKPLKIKLFSFDDATDNEYYTQGFEAHISQLGLEATRLNYGGNLCIYKLFCDRKDVLDQVVAYPGVHKVSFFPQYTYEFPNIVRAKKQIDFLPMPVEGEVYPIIGVIDSGIAPQHKYLNNCEINHLQNLV